MKILDAEDLADGACECYALMERELDAVFERPWRDLAAEMKPRA